MNIYMEVESEAYVSLITDEVVMRKMFLVSIKFELSGTDLLSSLGNVDSLMIHVLSRPKSLLSAMYMNLYNIVLNRNVHKIIPNK